MQWSRNFRTTTKTLALVFIMIFLLLTVAFTGYSTSETIVNIMNSTFSYYVQPALALGEMKSMAIQNRRMILNIAIASDKKLAENYEKRVLDNRKKIDDIIDQCSKMIKSPKEKVLFDNLRAQDSKLFVKQNEIIALRKSMENPENLMLRMMTGGDVANEEAKYIAIIEEIVVFLTEACAERNAWADAEGRKGTVRILAVSMIATIAGLLMGVFVSRTVTNPL